MAIPAALFNGSTLDVVLSASPSLLASAPEPTSLDRLADDALASATDAWVQQLVAGPRRSALFYDESCSFHLVVSLAPPSPSSAPLTRAQAAAFLLQSLQQPHLGLSADVSYVDAAPPAASGAPPPLPARTTSLAGLAAKVPLTPAPFPALAQALDAEGDGQAREVSSVVAGQAGGIQVANLAFNDREGRVWVAKGETGEWIGAWEFSCDLGFVRSHLTQPRVSITITATLRDDPALVGLLDRANEGGLAGARESTTGPTTGEDDEDYMQDSYDDVNLLSALSPISTTPLHLPFSRLPASYLPPMPPPSIPVPHTRSFSVSHTRSLSASNRAGGADSFLHSSLRRSIRRVLPVRSAVHLKMHTVPCSVGALGLPEGGQVWERDEEDGVVLCVEVSGPAEPSSAGDGEGFEIEGIDITVEGAGASRSASSSSGGSASHAHDIEVREIRFDRDSAASPWPVFLPAGGATQHNFLYALARIPAAVAATSSGSAAFGFGTSGAEDAAVGTVPIAVASSPQQRFTARFGADEVAAASAPSTVLSAAEPGQPGLEGRARASSRASLRNVAVVVRGRPVTRSKRAAGYAVPDAASGAELENEEADEVESPTRSFGSRWHCTLDTSCFARRAQTRATAFTHSSAPIIRPSSIAAPPVPSARPGAALALQPTLRTYAPPLRPQSMTSAVEVESVAGSKRHTMSSLATLSLKSPIMSRKGSNGFPSALLPARPSLDRAQSHRALPPTPLSPPASAHPSSSAAGAAAKRFFSLPHTNSSGPTLASPAPSAPSIIAPVRTETPPPMADKRASLPTQHGGASTPSVGGLLDRPREVRRTSWMSNLVQGSSNAGSPAPSQSRPGSLSATPQPPSGVTTWDRAASSVNPGSSHVGLGLDGATMPAVPANDEDLPQSAEPIQQQTGKILVSVSLVPLRTAKSRRPRPFAGGDAAARERASSVGRTNENLPPPVLPGLAPPSPDPSAAPSVASTHATPHFAFPPSPGSSSPGESPAAPSSPVPPFISDATAETELRALAERTNLATSRMPRVNLLDVFLVEVFVFNQSESVKRFTVGVPPEAMPGAEAGGEGERFAAKGRRVLGEKEGKVARLVPLENDVRIGCAAPLSLLPFGCLSRQTRAPRLASASLPSALALTSSSNYA
ncbi:hypothetical protein Rhopal_006667-T1 [Rhodotorula paludigena]|uniref:Proteophosphoglycan ppg4 n=1 Tax=Rhodotorula paludigena TaxID=86838 RepID=A0AAV5GUM5_9BASI|nr:hypothetical protein Rhopal_006667-T1 [Rhodotorula paludigena]